MRPSLDQGQEQNCTMHADANQLFRFPKRYKQVHYMNADAGEDTQDLNAIM